MKKVFYLLLIGGAMLICPHQSKADPYYLVRTINNSSLKFEYMATRP